MKIFDIIRLISNNEVKEGTKFKSTNDYFNSMIYRENNLYYDELDNEDIVKFEDIIELDGDRVEFKMEVE